ncbi:MAG: prolyl oligopeptidase family serine peptidase [Solidesulfovibrio sp.]
MVLRAVFSLPFLVALAVVWSMPAMARAGERPFDINAMLRVAIIDMVRVSADGKRAAFTVTRAAPDGDGVEMHSRIHVADTVKGVSRPVTPDKQQCDKPRFSLDGSRLAYLVQGDAAADAVVMQLATGQTKRLTHGQTDVLDLAFSPDGKSLAMTVTAIPKAGEGRGIDSDVEVLDESGVATGLRLYSLTASAAPKLLVTDREVGAFAFSPDGSRIVFETTAQNTPPRGRRGKSASGASAPVDAGHSDLAVVNVQSGVVTSLVATDALENSPCYSPDGKWVAYVATAGPGFYYNAARIMVVAATGGEPRALAETPDARPELLGWASGGDFLYVREPKGTGAVLLALPFDGGAAREISDTPHVVAQASLSPSGAAFGLVLTDSSMPAEAFVTPADHFAPKAVSTVNKDFAAFRTAKTEVVHWQAPDGQTIEGLYVHPVLAAQGPPPLLVELHGGPALVADRQYLGALNYYPLAVFAEHGYAIFQPNIRGSDGYGTAFRRANIGDWGGADYADLQSGIDALVSKGLADPNRLGIMGWSYGGYLTAWAIGHSQRFKAASVGAGITNLVSQCGSMDLPDFIPLYFGGEVYERFELLFDRSPLKYAAAITTPTLFQHGVADERVPYTQSLELYTALSRLGVTTRLAAYPRSGHDVTEPGLIRDLMARNLDWFTRFVPTTTSPGSTTASGEQPASPPPAPSQGAAPPLPATDPPTPG